MPDFPNQEDIIICHLKDYGKITSWEAIQLYRITRISAVIFNLRQAGWDIRTTNKVNGRKHFGEYSLESKTKKASWEETKIWGTDNQMSLGALSPK
jgi:hypothetical protein